MCGIAGIVDFDRMILPESIGRMCRSIKHRGPDDQGIWIAPHVGIGHVRLSILDVSSAGHQPMANEDNTQIISYNGEIYNFQSLKATLRDPHQFISGSDTELLVHLWEENGVSSINRLNGIFAFAVWESRVQRLTLVRDPLGVKPLYYYHHGNRIVFGSEIKALLAGGVPRELNMFAMAEHFTFQNTFGDRSFYKGISLLPAGHHLQFDRNGIRQRQYYEPVFNEDAYSEFQAPEYARQVRVCFEDAVHRQLLSDVPVGTYLSGGMDTGAIAAAASTIIPGISSFCCGFDVSRLPPADKVFNELDEARSVADFLGTSHHQLLLNHDEMERSLTKTIWHLDEPRMGISYQVQKIAEMVSRSVKVVLSGVGGDELFAGYPWRYEWCSTDGTPRKAYSAAVRFFDDENLSSLFSPEASESIRDYSSWESFQSVMNPCQAKNPYNRALFFDLKTFLNGILIVDDKLNMAHSVEARVPFLDLELVHCALAIPPSAKLAGTSGKAVLREAMKGLLPESIITRVKRGFTPPDRIWMKEFSMPYLKSIIFSHRALSRGLFRESTIHQVVNDHLSGQKDQRFLLWSLAGFELMMRLFFDECVLESPA